MSNEDIQKATDRIRGAAETILKMLTQEKVDDIKRKTGREKGVALNEVITNVTDTINKIYGRDSYRELPDNGIEARYQPISEYARYMIEFDDLDEAKRFSKVVQKLPIVDSKLYKYKGRFYMLAGLMSSDESIIYEMRRAGVEYSQMLTVNSPESMFISEHAELVIEEDAVVHLADLAR
jgi:negative regulator of genetic competence, sporulation and motility